MVKVKRHWRLTVKCRAASHVRKPCAGAMRRGTQRPQAGVLERRWRGRRRYASCIGSPRCVRKWGSVRAVRTNKQRAAARCIGMQLQYACQVSAQRGVVLHVSRHHEPSTLLRVLLLRAVQPQEATRRRPSDSRVASRANRNAQHAPQLEKQRGGVGGRTI